MLAKLVPLAIVGGVLADCTSVENTELVLEIVPLNCAMIRYLALAVLDVNDLVTPSTAKAKKVLKHYKTVFN